MFFICATILAFGGWQMAFRRVPEAIASAVPVVGIITLIILLAIVFGGHHMTSIYHWTDAEHVEHDKILRGKKAFFKYSLLHYLDYTHYRTMECFGIQG